MSHIKSIIQEMIESRLSEAAEGTKLTNGEALKIGKEAKKMAEKVRKGGGPLADKDASYLEMFASDAFSRNLKLISRTMNGGETENREQVFQVVSKVIGKDRAHLLSRGKF
jgi:hypothetical protein